MKNIRTKSIYVLVLTLLLMSSIYTIITNGGTIYLEDIDSGTTSPTGEYRWLDIANQPYSNNYKASYNYTQAEVEVSFDDIGETFHGILVSENLKPNFAYQVKLVGYPGTIANEQIGLVGRWWQEEWNGAAWVNGHNLNDKGNGSSPNPNDDLYYLRKNITDPSSPTGLKYKFTGYVVFDYFITNEYGNATLSFEANSSYHVLWKTTQRTHTVDDGPIKNSTFDVNTSSPAYDIDYPEQTVDIFGEWERLPIGNVFLDTGCYNCQFVITEESFHGDGGVDAGNWAAAMGKNASFEIADIYVDDDAPPEITNIHRYTSTPLDTNPLYGWVNITCNVSDNYELKDVILHITKPDSTFNNVSMNKKGINVFYYNSSTTFSQIGNYSYKIWANDTLDNINMSSSYIFSMPPNYDINMDGLNDIMDINLVALIFGSFVDPPGSIREDVDNNGIIDVLDLSIVANYFGQTWM
jgi:hypothetical protein